MDGWIKLHRSLLDKPLWVKEKFTKGQAWVDLLLLANHTDKKVLFDSEMVVVKRGQLITSTLKLSERWQWNRKTVVRFLSVLERDRMVTAKRDNRKTLINVVNYSVYQDLNSDGGTTKGTTMGQLEGQLWDNSRDTNKKEKNDKNDKKEIIPQKAAPSFTTIRELYNSVCGSYPRLVKMSDGRKRAIRAKLSSGFTLDDFKKAFEKAESSDFLKGKNDRNWVASFDWMIKGDNMLKILEGNYDNKPKSTPKKGDYPHRDYDYDLIQRNLMNQ